MVGSAFAIAVRLPILEAPSDTEVTALFPDDVIAVYGPNDHGWWEYTMHRDSDRDALELCEAIHAAMVERFPIAIPGTGVIIVDAVGASLHHTSTRTAACPTGGATPSANRERSVEPGIAWLWTEVGLAHKRARNANHHDGGLPSTAIS